MNLEQPDKNNPLANRVSDPTHPRLSWNAKTFLEPPVTASIPQPEEIKTVAHLVCRFLPNGILTFANESFCHYFNKQRHQIIGTNFLFLIPEIEREFVHKNWCDINPNNPLQTYEHQVLTIAREIHWLKWTIRGIFNPHCRLTEIQAVGQDITPYKQTEQRLKLGEEHFQLLIEGLKDSAIYLLDFQGNIATWNLGAERIYRIKESEIIGKHFSCFFTPEDIKNHQPIQDLERAIAAGQTEVEGWRLRGDGTQFWAHVVVIALRDDQGNVRGFGKVTRDLTKSTQAEAAFKKSEATNRALIQAIPDMIFRLSQEGNFLDFKAAKNVKISINLDHILGKNISEVFPLEMTELVWNSIQKAKETDETQIVEYQLYNLEKLCYFEARIVACNPDEFIIIIRDITAGKQAEEALIKSEEKFRAIFEQAGVGMVTSTLEGRFFRVNPKFCEIIGYTHAELLSRTYKDITHPDDLVQEISDEELLKLKHFSTYATEKRYIRRDGSIVWANLTLSLVREPSGEPLYYVAVVEDITERKRAENRLAKINECFLNFSSNPLENINALTALCGELLGANFALYNRREGENFRIIGQWSLVPQENMMNRLDHHLCNDVFNAVHDELFILQNLLSYAANETHHNLNHSQLETYIGKIVKCQNYCIGILCIIYQKDFNPSEEERRLIGIISAAIGVEEERLRIEEALMQNTERERLMRAISQRIRRSLNLTDILNTTVAEVQQFLQCDRVLILRLYPDGNGQIISEAVNFGEPSLLGLTFSHQCLECYPACYQEEKLHSIDEAENQTLKTCLAEFLPTLGHQPQLVIPILQSSPQSDLSAYDSPLISNAMMGEANLTQNRLWGLLIVQQCLKSRQWQQWEIDWLMQLTTQVGIATQQSQLYQQLQNANEELQRLATVDGLTQVANRRRFDEYLRQEWRLMARQKAPLSLILCDLDFFKVYNDTYGHQAGDECLQQVAAVMRQVAKRPNDLVARYGGEEFAVILPHTNTTGALCVAEAIRTTVKALEIHHQGSSVNQFVTLSLGIASIVPVPDCSPDILTASADQALYQAKARGRDQVVISQSQI